MPESTAKKNLLQEQQEQQTPTKKIVTRQINSWMQTNDKNQNMKKFNIQSVDITRFKMRKIPRQNISSKRHSQADSNMNVNNQIQNQFTNVILLKKRMDDLMKTFSKTKRNNQKTKQSSLDKAVSSNGSKNTIQMFKRQPLILVNQFNVQQKEKKQFHEFTLVPRSKPLPICQSAATRKTSLRKIDRKQRQKQGGTAYCHYIELKKRNKIDFQKGDFLASVSRKSSSILITIKQRKS